MLYSSYDFAIDPSIPTMNKKDGSTFIGQRNGLSDGDRRFLSNNVRLSQAQIREIQAQLNNGNPNPPANGRIENNF